MSQGKLNLRIGELLIESDILTRSDLEQAAKTATSTGLPIGRVLIMAGFVSERDFNAALQTQSLVRDSLLPLDTAIAVLKLVADMNLPFDQALKESGFELVPDRESNKLGELLLEAECVCAADLEQAIATSSSTGLPLGRLLISLGSLSDELLPTVLNAQELIRAGKISRSKAIGGVRAAHERRKDLEQHLKEIGFYQGPHHTSIRLGQMLLMSGLLNQAQVDRGLELCLTDKKFFGQVLVDEGLLEAVILRRALNLQEMVVNGTLQADEAVKLLGQAQHANASLEQGLASLAVPPTSFKTKVRFIDVLKVAALIDPAERRFDMPPTSEPGSADALSTAAALLKNQIIDERIYLGSLRCYYLIATGFLNMQQGIIALNYFHHKICSFDDVLREMKWTIRTHVATSDQLAKPEGSVASV